MSMTGLEPFDTTVHKTNRWLGEVMRELGWEDKHMAYLALRAALHALRDRLGVSEVAQLGAQLPMLVRGIYYEGWDPMHAPHAHTKDRRRSHFLSRITEECTDADPERVARGVFAVLARRVSEGEIDDVKSVLPADLRDLWP
jgi:uncharacterized protein (DUF2267 family)